MKVESRLGINKTFQNGKCVRLTGMNGVRAVALATALAFIAMSEARGQETPPGCSFSGAGAAIIYRYSGPDDVMTYSNLPPRPRP